MVDVVLATKNEKKRLELVEILAAEAPYIRLVDASWSDVAETGATFEENALSKARAVNMATGLVALADDSGLEVKALGSEPGVRSARYSGVDGPDRDAENNRLLLKRMSGIADRRCRFRCVVAVVGDDFEETVEGTVEGTLREVPAGEGGFGYDPLFEPVGWCRTFAQVSARDKAQLSHRGRALRKAIVVLGRITVQ